MHNYLWAISFITYSQTQNLHLLIKYNILITSHDWQSARKQLAEFVWLAVTTTALSFSDSFSTLNYTRKCILAPWELQTFLISTKRGHIELNSLESKQNLQRKNKCQRWSFQNAVGPYKTTRKNYICLIRVRKNENV